MAWIFVNDSLSTTVCLQWEAEIIAIALMHLAGRYAELVIACLCISNAIRCLIQIEQDRIERLAGEAVWCQRTVLVGPVC